MIWENTLAGLICLSEPGLVAGVYRCPFDGSWGWWVARDRHVTDSIDEGETGDVVSALRAARAAMRTAQRRLAA